jgi:hypothetical protein
MMRPERVPALTPVVRVIMDSRKSVRTRTDVRSCKCAARPDPPPCKCAADVARRKAAPAHMTAEASAHMAAAMCASAAATVTAAAPATVTATTTAAARKRVG